MISNRKRPDRKTYNALANQAGYTVLQWNMKEKELLFSGTPERYLFSKNEPEAIINAEKEPIGVHPDDVRVFRDFLSSVQEKDAAMASIRLRLSEGGYVKASFSGIMSEDDEKNPILAIAWRERKEDAIEDLPASACEGDEACMEACPVHLKRELSIRQAMTPNAILVTAFHMGTRKLMRFDGDILPENCRSVRTISEMKEFLLGHTHPDDMREVIKNEIWMNEPGVKEGTEFRSFECRLRTFWKKREVYHWSKVTFVRFLEGDPGPEYLCLIVEDVHKEKEKMQELIREAKQDPANSILTRALFEKLCIERREDRSLCDALNALLLVETDPFETEKGIRGEDRRGFVQEEIEKLLLSSLNEDITAVRLSNMKYLVSMHRLNSIAEIREQTNILQQKLRVRLSEKETVTVSIGVTLCTHDRENGYRFVYGQAETALGRAKKYGGNRVVFYGQNGMSEEEPESEKDVLIRTFGRFEVFVNDRPILFRHEKAKEMLAVLVDRRGGFVTNREIVGYLWESEPVSRVVMSRSRKVAMWLRETLKEYGIEYILETENRAKRIRPEKVRCDLYDYISHRKEYANTYGGVYMNEYSWAEITTAELNREFWA